MVTVLQAGSTVTIYAWGAQTESGTGALNPDEGGEPSIMTDTIEVGTVQVVTSQEWNRMTGANDGYGSYLRRPWGGRPGTAAGRASGSGVSPRAAVSL